MIIFKKNPCYVEYNDKTFRIQVFEHFLLMNKTLFVIVNELMTKMKETYKGVDNE